MSENLDPAVSADKQKLVAREETLEHPLQNRPKEEDTKQLVDHRVYEDERGVKLVERTSHVPGTPLPENPWDGPQHPVAAERETNLATAAEPVEAREAARPVSPRTQYPGQNYADRDNIVTPETSPVAYDEPSAYPTPAPAPEPEPDEDEE